ncbi:MAG: acyl-CoA dehydrogenase family protein [Gammaproteobacteria bacterium]|nr:acyl-CoA dehydrogenase family protein [Gammaproteobacteria bacterium]
MEFRTETRAWIEENCPTSIRERDKTPSREEISSWRSLYFDRGWSAPTWPSKYGGGGLEGPEVRILQEELRRANAGVPVGGMGLTMIGPALLEFGSEEQCYEHLPSIVRQEIVWCQGYSEPGSGSDLAGLQTKAIEDGDDYIINGSKIWTSGADHADWMFCLVRTDQNASKHEGISFILFSMKSPGVTVKPIRLISGASPFCETFFDDVRVPKRNVVSEVNKGWTVAKRLLQYERTSIGGMGGGGSVASRGRVRTIADVAKECVGENDGRIADPDLRDRLVSHRINDQAFALTARRTGEEGRAGVAPTFVSSMLKYYGTEQNKNRYDLLMSMKGVNGLGWTGEDFDRTDLDITRQWLRSKANSIEGGTSEVQLNIIAKRILGLPD